MESQNEDARAKKAGNKQHNILPLWGNESTMNLNPLILANIQGSSYFKVGLFKLKTYHEVVDEIYYQVKHLEPWERGSRKTAGQTGMCGGVRGVGAGGIVSTAFCLLYKLYTLRLTRKQVNGLLTHTDSPFIRALGFMYIRYTQPPGDLFDWYEPYLQDEEEIDPKAGGGQAMTIGQMLRQWLTKLEFFSTLFPRIPVPIQKQIEQKLSAYAQEYGITFNDNVRQNYQEDRTETHRRNQNVTANKEPETQYNQQQQQQQQAHRNNSRGGSGNAGVRVAEREKDKVDSRYGRERDRERSFREKSREEHREKTKSRDYRRGREASSERDYEKQAHNRDTKYKDRDRSSSSSHYYNSTTKQKERERSYR